MLKQREFSVPPHIPRYQTIESLLRRIDFAISRRKEISYARSHLGALGTIVLSNNEAIYPGDALFAPFFAYLNARSNKPEVVFIHPNAPVEKLNGTFISADPSESPLLWSVVSPVHILRSHTISTRQSFLVPPEVVSTTRSTGLRVL